MALTACVPYSVFALLLLIFNEFGVVVLKELDILTAFSAGSGGPNSLVYTALLEP